jgi:hypothetical protein
MVGQDDNRPEVERRRAYPTRPDDEPCPLTPLEAWYVFQGWQVQPAAGIDLETVLKLPGKIEGGEGLVCLWQS